MRLLHITPTDLSAPRGGRAMLARVHRDCLGELMGDDVADLRISGTTRLSAALTGRVDGVDAATLSRIVERIDAAAIDTIWLDGSNLGPIATMVRRRRPRVRVVTFCHNVEARFFLGAWRRGRSPRTLGVLLANYQAERAALRSSSAVIALNRRDSELLRRVYRRPADHLLPLAVADQLNGPMDERPVADDAPLLFVGGAFYANRAGIEWFGRTVAPALPIRTQVVGHGMDACRDLLARAGTIDVIGAVDDLEPVYRRARAVIAPIFDGSGMKTKVAEALMFGKRVIGTREAFTGYEAIAGRIGWMCETAADFAAAVAQATTLPLKTLDPGLRRLYEAGFSRQATTRRIAAILAGEMETVPE